MMNTPALPLFHGQPALRVAVVGHTNVGKTSLLRTLTRQAGFGEVADRPGVTRDVKSIDLELQGEKAVRFFDTPGLEDAVALQDYMLALPPESLPDRPSHTDRVRKRTPPSSKRPR